MERPGLRGIIQMRAAAQLDAVAAHIDHADDIAVFFTKQCGRADFSRFIDWHFTRVDHITGQDGLIDHPFDLADLLGRHGGEMREVKAQAVGFDERARLVDMIAQDVAQRALQQVRRAVGTADGAASG